MQQTSIQAGGFVICIRNDGYSASLEPRKIYQTIPDEEAGKQGQLRVVDESGDDYLYPAEYFVEVELPPAVQAALKAAA
jgi:hypothetical protein